MIHSLIPRHFRFAACFAVFFCLAVIARAGDSAPPITERVGAAVESATTSIEKTSAAAADKISEMWQRIDASRLKNRTRDEIVAWVVMGLLVGALAGLFSVLRNTAPQRFLAVILGLTGAFVGGMISHVARLDFGMGPVLIRYEDLLLSLAGGLLLVVVVRLVQARRSKKI